MLNPSAMLLLFLTFIFAALEWTAEYKSIRWLIYITKPAMMLSLIAWVWTYSDLPSLLGNISTFHLLWFVVALVFCLAGDVFLMLPERFFLPGLAAFLVGHIFYIVGFGGVLPPQGTYLPGAIVALLVILTGAGVYRRLAQGMEASGNTRMKIPVTIYALIISIMLYSALTTLLDDQWHYTSALWVSVGALLFCVSDIMNAWVRFVGPITNARVKIMLTYHLAQIALALGAALHFAV